MQSDSKVVEYMKICKELGRAEATFDEVELRALGGDDVWMSILRINAQNYLRALDAYRAIPESLRQKVERGGSLTDRTRLEAAARQYLYDL